MPIHNEIFDTYRLDQKKIQDAIELLRDNNYIVLRKDEITDNYGRDNK